MEWQGVLQGVKVSLDTVSEVAISNSNVSKSNGGLSDIVWVVADVGSSKFVEPEGVTSDNKLSSFRPALYLSLAPNIKFISSKNLQSGAGWPFRKC